MIADADFLPLPLPKPQYIVQWAETPVPVDHPMFKIGSETFDNFVDAKALVKTKLKDMRKDVSLYKMVYKNTPDGLLSFDILTLWHDFLYLVKPLDELTDE